MSRPGDPEYDARIREVVDSAPPLTDDARDTLRRLFRRPPPPPCRYCHGPQLYDSAEGLCAPCFLADVHAMIEALAHEDR
jgi:hypothetical protein